MFSFLSFFRSFLYFFQSCMLHLVLRDADQTTIGFYPDSEHDPTPDLLPPTSPPLRLDINIRQRLFFCFSRADVDFAVRNGEGDLQVHIHRGHPRCRLWNRLGAGEGQHITNRGEACVVYWFGVWAGHCECGGSGRGRQGSGNAPFRVREAIEKEVTATRTREGCGRMIWRVRLVWCGARYMV